jgi:hypothetical protein
MSTILRSVPGAPRNLCDLFLRDLASLLLLSRTTTSTLRALRSECAFSDALTSSLDRIAATNEAGETYLRRPLAEAGVLVLKSTDGETGAFISALFSRVPAGAAPAIFATEVVVNLRLLAQHLELKARLAAEEAMLVGQDLLCSALVAWAAEWRNCGRTLRDATVRARAGAYVADVNPVPQEA